MSVAFDQLFLRWPPHWQERARERLAIMVIDGCVPVGQAKGLICTAYTKEMRKEYETQWDNLPMRRRA